ncbi:uncharacterized protein B0J16DRAFT_276821 [Fusarium flagelliforme]|uniref:uncharacterized protein n=1 Tax=Fusarium flagelliforme TaxID=2675880 RepID=UPI001E8EE121|nr:uncharacterized protein B0J16DRAFT_276821 [Fusarium flagelliforme]KAH7169804.1 hypothetical protein B0J16DRAFT_276821 [Fusarium flagelliforme]
MCATPILLNLYFMLMSAFRGSQGPQVCGMMLTTPCRNIPMSTLMDTAACFYQKLNLYPLMDSLSTKSKTIN